MSTVERPLADRLALQYSLDAGTTWVDFLGRVNTISSQRGGTRNAVSQSVDVGTLQVTLVNDQDPLAGGVITPNTPIRLASTSTPGYTEEPVLTTPGTPVYVPKPLTFNQVVTRTNLASDPAATSATTPNTKLGWGPQWFGGTGWAGTTTTVTGASDGPLTTLKTYVRKTWTTVGTSTPAAIAFQFVNGGLNAYPVTPGDTFTISAYFRHSWTDLATGYKAYMYVQWIDATGANLTVSQGADVNALAANTWYRPFATVTVPAGAAYMQPLITYYSTTSGTSPVVVGSTMDGTGLLVEKASQGNDYFDGGFADTINTTTGYGARYDWTGTANGSPSTITAYRNPDGIRTNYVLNPHLASGTFTGSYWSPTRTFLSSGASDGGAYMHVVQGSASGAHSTGDGATMTVGQPALAMGDVVTMSFDMRSDPGYIVTCALKVDAGAGGLGQLNVTGDGSWHRYSLSYTATGHSGEGLIGNAQFVMGLTGAANGYPGASAYFDLSRVIVEVNSSGDYFDGATASTDAEQNLCANPTFYDNANGWNVRSASLTPSPSENGTATFSTVPGAQSSEMNYTIAGTPGLTYAVAADVFCPGTLSTSYSVSIESYDASWNYLGGSYDNLGQHITGTMTDWQTIWTTYVAPAGTAWIIIYPLNGSAPATAAETIYIRNVLAVAGSNTFAATPPVLGQGFKNTWTGTANQSAAVQTTLVLDHWTPDVYDPPAPVWHSGTIDQIVYTGTVMDINTTYSLDKSSGKMTTFVGLSAVDAVQSHKAVTRYGAVSGAPDYIETWAERIDRLSASAVTPINPPSDTTVKTIYTLG